MMLAWQDIAVGIVIALAGVYMFARTWRRIRRGEAGCCGRGCDVFKQTDDRPKPKQIISSDRLSDQARAMSKDCDKS